MLECKNCCYFTVTDDPDWTRKDGTPIEHCCFHEWGHGDWETAPCDEPDYDNDDIFGYDDYPDDYYEGWD